MKGIRAAVRQHGRPRLRYRALRFTQDSELSTRIAGATMIDQLVERVKGVLRLQTAAFEEIEASRGATLQALIVVVVVAIAAAIGGLGDGGSDGILSAISGAVVGWIVFSALCYVIGTRFVASPETQSSWGE